MKRLLVLPLFLLLAACQNAQLNQDFDKNRDFAAYRTFNWKEPALQYSPDDPRIKSDLTEQRIRAAVSEQLDQRGVRLAAAGAKGDVNVQTWLIVENRTDQVSTSYGGAWGGYWNGYWGGPGFTETRNVDYKVGTVQVDLFDAKDGKLVWRGSAEQIVRNNQNTPVEREAAIRDTVAKILSQYPPH